MKTKLLVGEFLEEFIIFVSVYIGLHFHPLVAISLAIIWIITFWRWRRKIGEEIRKNIAVKSKVDYLALERKYGRESCEQVSKSLEQSKELNEFIQGKIKELSPPRPYNMIWEILWDLGIIVAATIVYLITRR